MMLTAYFDEGGTHNDSAVAVLCGYFGPASEWKALSEDWQALLARENLPYYHAVDSAHAAGHFKGKSLRECNRVHREVVEIITRRGLVGIGAGVRLAEFRHLYEQVRQETQLKAVQKPEYHFCFRQALTYLGQHTRKTFPNEQVSLIFEETSGVMGRVLDVFEGLSKDLTFSFAGPPLFSPKMGNPQLQAADVLAYEMALDLRRNFQPTRTHASRGAWLALADHATKQASGAGLLHCKAFITGAPVSIVSPPGE
jgi:hypothetical protein